MLNKKQNLFVKGLRESFQEPVARLGRREIIETVEQIALRFYRTKLKVLFTTRKLLICEDSRRKRFDEERKLKDQPALRVRERALRRVLERRVA